MQYFIWILSVAILLIVFLLFITRSLIQRAIIRLNSTFEPNGDDPYIWFDQTEHETLHIKSDDGLQLTGYLFKSKIPSKRLAYLLHGYRCNAKIMADYIRFYNDAGFHVFAPDARAHGNSEGKYIGMGWLDRKDHILWLERLIRIFKQDINIVVHGISMGASAAMMLSGEPLRYQVKCLIEDCGYTSAYEEFRLQFTETYRLPKFPFLTLANLMAKIFAKYSFREASALDQVKKAELPIYFIHGGSDDFVPTEMVYTLYEAAPVEKEIWIVEKADHADSLYDAKKEYIKRSLAFCERYFEA